MDFTAAINTIISDARGLAAVLGFYGLILVTAYNSFDRRRSVKREKRERRDDMQKAIYAEVRAYVALLQRNELARFGGTMAKKIRDENFVPFIPRETHNAVFNSVLPNIHVLPVETIDIITVYYQTVGAISDLVDDMRGEGFAKLPPERRALVYEDYIDTKIFTMRLGMDALTRMEIFARGGSNAMREWDHEKAKVKSENNRKDVKTWLNAKKN